MKLISNRIKTMNTRLTSCIFEGNHRIPINMMAVRSFFHGDDSNFTDEENVKLQADRLIELALFKKPDDIGMVRIDPEIDPSEFIRAVVGLKRATSSRPSKMQNLKRFIHASTVSKHTKNQVKLIIKEMEKAHMLKIINKKVIYA